jgi:hypothetical protein
MSAPSVVGLIDAYLRRYVVFGGDQQVLALSLWVIHTHAFEAAEATPYPLVTSPEKRSGKSRLLEVLELIVGRGWRVTGVSEAVLFRKIGQDRPTLLFDELDAVFSTYVEKTEPIRVIINAGNRRGGAVSRCVGPHHAVEDFEVFCPKCLAGIESGRLPETIRDRSIPIGLHRKTADEPVERFRFRRASREAEEVIAEVERWVEDNLEQLTETEPDLPDELNDRAAEGWEPLLAIADALGEDVGEKARRAALSLSAEEDVEDSSFGTQLLIDIREFWIEVEFGSTLKSEEICSKLKELAERPWAAWGKNRPVPGITQRDLARLLRPYGIRPKTVRLGPDQTAKGYHREQFGEAWRRYAPDQLGGADEEGTS